MKKTTKKLSIILLCVILFATVGIIAISSDKDIKISDDYKFEKESEMLDYIDTVKIRNAELLSKKLEDVPATVTFSKAMTEEDLDKFVASYDIDIHQIQSRGYDSAGNRTTAMLAPDNNEFSGIERLLEGMAESKGGVFVGVIGMYIVTDAETVSEIQKDDSVLLIDTSTDRYHISGRTAKNRNTTGSLFKEEDSDYSFAHSIAWDAEDLELVNYAKK